MRSLSRWITCLVMLCFWLGLPGSNQKAAASGFELLWALGGVDDNPDEFGDSIWGTSPAPGSPSTRDDDFYFAGSYPAPVGTVATSELASLFEDSLTMGSPLTARKLLFGGPGRVGPGRGAETGCQGV